jgi:hypothetical protein
MYTTNLIFMRQDGVSTTNIAVAEMDTKDKITQGEALNRLERAVASWVMSTKSGRTCWNYSGGDLNIGDLAMYEVEFRAKKSKAPQWLRNNGIEDVRIDSTYICEDVIPYDHVLGTTPEEDLTNNL